MTKADTNLHTIAGTSVVDRDDLRYREYRKKWNEWPENYCAGPFPLHLDIEATNLCNLKCTFCENTYNKYRYGMMSRDVWEVIVKEAAENKLYSLKFTLRGEPLLHKDLPRMVREAKDAGVLDVYFNTNAVRLTPDVSRRLIEAGLDRISISFEGIEKGVYEKYRIGAHFETVVNNIRQFRKIRDDISGKKPFIRIQTVMVPEMIGREQEYADFWLAIADEVAYLDMRDEEENPDHTGRVSDWACPQIWQRMAVTQDGNILPCVQDIFEKMSLGNVRTTSIREAWNSVQEQRYRLIHKQGRAHEIPSCDRCPFRENEISKLREGKGPKAR
ncbi:MAG: pyrroloquinoline quinone biosynthesis protein PqqE [Methanoregula sp. PtaU1.Bin051]|nr:MAG: pyrroloquinoline quinone biosynthesis protein PqqE [Methanoregula sp. PtaU1.Bin051]